MTNVLDIERATVSILRHWAQADAVARERGERWFSDAYALAAELSPDDIERGAGIIAALSPRAQWLQNVNWARKLTAASDAGADAPPYHGLHASADAAWRIARGERPLDVLHGRKVRSFYRNIMGNHRAVTVDMWAMRVAGLTAKSGPTPLQYSALTAAFRRAAREAGTDPSTMQATTWIVARGRAD